MMYLFLSISVHFVANPLPCRSETLGTRVCQSARFDLCTKLVVPVIFQYIHFLADPLAYASDFSVHTSLPLRWILKYYIHVISSTLIFALNWSYLEASCSPVHYCFFITLLFLQPFAPVFLQLDLSTWLYTLNSLYMLPESYQRLPYSSIFVSIIFSLSSSLSLAGSPSFWQWCWTYHIWHAFGNYSDACYLFSRLQLQPKPWSWLLLGFYWMLRKRLSFGVLYKLRPSFASVLHRSSPGPAVCASLSFCVHEDLRVSCFPLLVADAYFPCVLWCKVVKEEKGFFPEWIRTA